MANNIQGSLDTNILLRLILGDIPEQTVLVEKLLATNQRFEVADITFVEMIFVLEKIYRIPRANIVENVLALIRNPQINCNRKLFELSLPLYAKHSNLSIVDCALTQYAVLNKSTPLYTFDKSLAKSIPKSTQLLA